MAVTILTKDINERFKKVMGIIPQMLPNNPDVTQQDVIRALLWLNKQGRRTRNNWEKTAEKIREAVAKI